MTKRKNLKESFTLAHGFSPWPADSIAVGLRSEHHGESMQESKVAHLTTNRKQRE
jgi:hypothetical protein